MNLDDTLAAWAAAVRLPAGAAAEIYQRIVATPVAAAPRPVRAGRDTPGLDPAWWRTFTADFTAGLVSTTRPASRAA